ncbi:MAG TPA: MobF family relaxase [Urbifossiella sp.]|nr:MobF family relaxase [Urbifossiella sp.]
MLRINQQRSAAGAKSYFEEGLAREDYYTQDAIVGRWGGRGAERLGLVGEVQRDAFLKLCDNRNPNSGGPLTPRSRHDRTVGYDLNFHAPKSLSLLYTLTRDERLLATFQGAVRETMRELEGDVRTRVRQGGQNAERTTGNLVYAEFVHLTARPVNGVPDPHLHAHCFTFNATFDAAEDRWKAGQFREVVRDAPYFEAAFHARLSRAVADLGLGVVRTKAGWEVAGLGPELLAKFSRRSAKIEELARQKGITDAREKGELGARTRERKGEPRSLDALRAEWKGRLTEDERRTLKDVLTRRQPQAEPPVSARAAVDHALGHGFERASVAEERRLLATALKRGYGSVRPEDAARDFSTRGEVIRRRYGDRNFVTTREVLAEEAAMTAFAREGRGTCRAFEPRPERLAPTELNRDQADAVRHVLTSTDRVTLIRGAAGTGKTTLLRSAAAEIRARGSEVCVFAPTTEAARGVLRKEGFGDAETVARLLADRSAQEKVRGKVLWVDEAGLVGVRDMRQLFRVAREQNARVVLVGDERQHGSVPRGDAFRLLQTQAGLTPAVVADIRRQQGEYRKAVEALAGGNLDAGFQRLDRLGGLREAAGEARHDLLARDYLAAVKEGKSALVVAPTHAEGRAVTAHIRMGLKDAGLLGRQERTFDQLVAHGFTEAERRDGANYQAGDVIRFIQNAKGGFRKGETATVLGRGADGRVMAERKNGKPVPLPLDAAQRFDVYQRRDLPLAAGDRIRIAQNGMTADGKGRLMNGALHRIAAFDRRGNIVLESGLVVPKEYGHLAHGYCATSHASQGKTVDKVFVAVGPESFAAASKEQFYVSVSRGRESATVYCEDKRDLLEAARRSSARMSATELAAAPKPLPEPRPSRVVRLVEHIRRSARATMVRLRAATRDRPAERDRVAGRETSRER